MLKKLFILWLFVFSFFVNVRTGQLLARKDLKKDYISEVEVDNYIQPYIDAGCFSGTILIAREGKVLFKKAYGLANREFGVPNAPATRFHISSVSKIFTAIAIMILKERGKLNVTDSLNKFISDYPQGNKITIHHLLTHTSGIPNVNSFAEYNQMSRFPHTPEKIILMFKTKPLNFQPGERYQYSNSNYNLLAYIIEEVSGSDYGEFLNKYIFEPLDMNDTGHRGDMSAIVLNIATGYTPHGPIGIKRARFVDWSIKTGNGSLYSTVMDLYKLDRALYTEKILSKSSLDQMFKDYIKGVGYGCFVGKRLNRRVVRANGRSPGFTACVNRYIDDEACIIILSNNYSPVPHMAVKDIAAILYGEKYDLPIKIESKEINPELLKRYTGQYQFNSDFYRPNAKVKVIEKEGHLVFGWSETYFSPLRTLTENIFLDRLFWAYIIFQKGIDGKVSGFIWRDTSDYLARKKI